ncbi:MAG: PIN domain-containing protein [Solirubrobacteraceae bacterium]
MRFLDTNVLLYVISRDASEEPKALRARELVAEGDVALSVQVLQEFYVQATRASRADALRPDLAAQLVESFTRFPVAPTTTTTVLAATSTSRRFVISYWDAAIIEAARSLGCEVVLSEDLSDGQDYGGVCVENPFRAVD